MAVMGRTKQMVRQFVMNQRIALNDEKKKKEESKRQDSAEERAEKEKILGSLFCFP